MTNLMITQTVCTSYRRNLSEFGKGFYHFLYLLENFELYLEYAQRKLSTILNINNITKYLNAGAQENCDRFDGSLTSQSDELIYCAILATEVGFFCLLPAIELCYKGEKN